MAKKTTITKDEARRLYREGNDAGRGYMPYADVAGDASIEAAIDAATSDGWRLVFNWTPGELAVLQNDDGEWMAIGGDAMGHGAWAVIISDEVRS